MLFKPDRLFSMIDHKEIPLGMQVFTDNPALIEVPGLTGFDLVMIDTGHSANNPRALEDLIRTTELAGMVPTPRAASISRCWSVGKYMYTVRRDTSPAAAMSATVGVPPAESSRMVASTMAWVCGVASLQARARTVSRSRLGYWGSLRGGPCIDRRLKLLIRADARPGWLTNSRRTGSEPAREQAGRSPRAEYPKRR